MWSVHTAGNAEKLGIPTATIASDGFAGIGHETARKLGFDSLPIVTVPHPFDRLGDSEVQKAAESIVDEIIHILTEPAEKVEKEYRNKHTRSSVKKPETFLAMPKCECTVKT